MQRSSPCPLLALTAAGLLALTGTTQHASADIDFALSLTWCDPDPCEASSPCFTPVVQTIDCWQSPWGRSAWFDPCWSPTWRSSWRSSWGCSSWRPSRWRGWSDSSCNNWSSQPNWGWTWGSSWGLGWGSTWGWGGSSLSFGFSTGGFRHPFGFRSPFHCAPPPIIVLPPPVVIVQPVVQPVVVLQDRRLPARACPGQTNTPTQINTPQPDPTAGLSTMGSEGISPDGTLPGPVARSKPLRRATNPSPDSPVAVKPIESRLSKPRVQAPTSSKPRLIGSASAPLKPNTQLATRDQRTTAQQDFPQTKPTPIYTPQGKPQQTQPAPRTSAQAKPAEPVNVAPIESIGRKPRYVGPANSPLKPATQLATADQLTIPQRSTTQQEIPQYKPTQLKPSSPAPTQVFSTPTSTPKPIAKPISTPTPTPFQARTDTPTPQFKPNAVDMVGPVVRTDAPSTGRVFNSSPAPQAPARSAQPGPAMSKPTFAPSRGAPAVTAPSNQIVGPVVGPVVAQPAPSKGPREK